jgi:hypothetical protein
MSDTIWVDVHGRSKGDLPRDNTIMLKMKSQLDRLSKKLNVAKLSEFYDYSELEDQYGDFDEEDPTGASDSEGDHQSNGSWYDAADAFVAVRAIHDHLAQHPEDLGLKPDQTRAHWPTLLMEELADCATVLEAAVSHGRQFRFLIVP